MVDDSVDDKVVSVVDDCVDVVEPSVVEEIVGTVDVWVDVVGTSVLVVSPSTGHVGKLLTPTDGTVSAEAPQDKVMSPVGLDPKNQIVISYIKFRDETLNCVLAFLPTCVLLKLLFWRTNGIILLSYRSKMIFCQRVRV